MENNEIMDNIDVQDVNEIVEDVVTSDKGILTTLGTIGGCAVLVGIAGCAIYKGYKFVAKKREESLEKKNSEDKTVEVETEVVEN